MFETIKTKAELDNAIASANGKIVVLDFYAPFCSPCKNLKDQLEKSVDKFSDKAVIYAVDTDDSDAYDLVVTDHNIRSVPTLVFYKDGVVVDRFVGAMASKVIEIIEKHS